MGAWIELPMVEIEARYDGRESTCELAHAFGVSQPTIWRRLVAAGAKMRPCGAPPGNKHKLGWHQPGGPLSEAHGYFLTYDRQGKNCRIHRGCWEAYYGPIPKGYNIHHVDGNPLNNEIGNLACISHGEHTRLHKRWRR